MDCLPRIEGIYQGDFIGWGGEKVYTPNCITYKFFDTIAPETIVFVAHTHYVGNTIKDAEVRFGFPYDVSLQKYMQTDRRVNHSVKIKSVS